MSQDYSIVHGEVVDTLQSWDLTDYYDACLCDPPYLLEFMGEAFDRQHKDMAGDNDGQRMYQWHLRWCREVYKVLKPGGFVLAFGGTRTSHRLACALEDVGFEIRDAIEWLYGSGFPKSTDISKQIDKRGGYPHLAEKIGDALRQARESRGLTAKYCDEHFCSGTTNWTWFEGRPKGQRAPTPETFSKIANEWPELEELRELVDEAEREIIGKKSSGAFNPEDKDRHTVGGSKSVEVDITAPSTSAAVLWSGYGTALKPAHEPIILAMKPCEGTFAQNALEWGVAGLNIDECRIGNDTSRGERYNNKPPGGSHSMQIAGPRKRTWDVPAGRWPANLILSHTPWCQQSIPTFDDWISKTKQYGGTREEYNRIYRDGSDSAIEWDCHPLCPVRLLDEQSGQLSGRANKGPSVAQSQRQNTYLIGLQRQSGSEYNYDSGGGASRFFYQAKVSTFEREIGMLGRFPCRVCGNLDSETHLNDKGDPVRCSRNAHPTQKPIDLCRYLATLLLPPVRPNDTRKLLIPFSGAGSEVAGALLAGWDDVTGIEQDAEYVQWSEARVQAVLRGELQEKGSGNRSRRGRGRSTGGADGTVDDTVGGTVDDTVDTSALTDLFADP